MSFAACIAYSESRRRSFNTPTAPGCCCGNYRGLHDSYVGAVCNEPLRLNSEKANWAKDEAD